MGTGKTPTKRGETYCIYLTRKMPVSLRERLKNMARLRHTTAEGLLNEALTIGLDVLESQFRDVEEKVERALRRELRRERYRLGDSL